MTPIWCSVVLVSNGIGDTTPFWCYRAAMAKQDTWTRITLRLPPDLHQLLTEAAGANSLNAEIVDRLWATMASGLRTPHDVLKLDSSFKELNTAIDNLQDRIENLEKQRAKK